MLYSSYQSQFELIYMKKSHYSSFTQHCSDHAVLGYPKASFTPHQAQEEAWFTHKESLHLPASHQPQAPLPTECWMNAHLEVYKSTRNLPEQSSPWLCFLGDGILHSAWYLP